MYQTPRYAYGIDRSLTSYLVLGIWNLIEAPPKVSVTILVMFYWKYIGRSDSRKTTLEKRLLAEYDALNRVKRT